MILRFEGGPFDGAEGVAAEAPVRLYVRAHPTEPVQAFTKSRIGTVPYVLTEQKATVARYVFEDLLPYAEWCGAVAEAS